MKTTSTIVFTGDISFDRYMDGKWNDPDLIAQPVLDFLHSSDHVVANVEGALINVAGIRPDRERYLLPFHEHGSRSRPA